jgi:hypothetical protein
VIPKKMRRAGRAIQVDFLPRTICGKKLSPDTNTSAKYQKGARAKDEDYTTSSGESLLL